MSCSLIKDFVPSNIEIHETVVWCRNNYRSSQVFDNSF